MLDEAQAPAATGVPVAPGGAAPTTRGALILRRFLRRRLAVGAAVVLLLLFLLAFVGPHFAPWDHQQTDPTAFLQPPSSEHWFGTTQIGQDVFAQTLRGLQKSLLIGFLAALFTTGLAGLLGASAGFFGGWPDRAISWVIDLLLVIPSFLILAILSPKLRGQSWLLLVVLLALFGWMITARVVRSLTLTLREREFVKAARYMGVPSRRIIVRHILPNMSSFLIIDATIAVGATILGESSLSYFGFGVQRPDVSLGTLIASGTASALTFPWLFIFAGGLLVLTVLCVSLVGDGLRDAFDPRATAVSPQVLRRAKGAGEEPAPALAASASPTAVLPAPNAPAGLGAPEEATPVETAPPAEDTVLQVRGLRVRFPTESGPLHAVRGLDLDVRRGEVVGIVGESGSGKSVSALAVMGLLPGHAHVRGSVRFEGRELVGLGDRDLSDIRGRRIAMVFQDPLSALTPVYTVGEQLAEAVLAHRDVGSDAAWARAVELLELVGIPDAERRAKSFPHEFSGGMRQRVMIAMAMANDPALIIADEPTTALDVTIQAQIVEVLRKAQQETGAAVVIISHDLGLVAGFADRVLVMYAGRVVEEAPVDDLFAAPRMPYTMGLLGSLPRLDGVRRTALTPVEGAPPSMVALPSGCPFSPRCPLAIDECRRTEPALTAVRGRAHAAACHRSGMIEQDGLTPHDVFPAPESAAPVPAHGRADGRTLVVHDLVKHFPLTKGAIFRRRVGTVRAVDGVSFDVAEGEVLGLVGESGCGKTTTIGEIMALTRPMGGRVQILGSDTAELRSGERARIRRQVGLVFQDPTDSLDPRMPVGDILAEGMETHGAPKDQQQERIAALLRRVGLEPSHAGRYPHEFSGGQRQRIGIARALSLEPKLVILDEPVSALDVSIRAGVVNLLMEIKRDLGLSYVFVAHDLSLVRHVADRVAVMYLGRIVEIGDVEAVYRAPAHPYTQALLSAIPIPDPVVERTRRRILLEGDPPSPTEVPAGCRFRARCPLYATLDEGRRAVCEQEDPALFPQGDDRAAACHYARPTAVV